MAGWESLWVFPKSCCSSYRVPSCSRRSCWLCRSGPCSGWQTEWWPAWSGSTAKHWKGSAKGRKLRFSWFPRSWCWECTRSWCATSSRTSPLFPSCTKSAKTSYGTEIRWTCPDPSTSLSVESFRSSPALEGSAFQSKWAGTRRCSSYFAKTSNQSLRLDFAFPFALTGYR